MEKTINKSITIGFTGPYCYFHESEDSKDFRWAAKDCPYYISAGYFGELCGLYMADLYDSCRCAECTDEFGEDD